NKLPHSRSPDGSRETGVDVSSRVQGQAPRCSAIQKCVLTSDATAERRWVQRRVKDGPELREALLPEHPRGRVARAVSDLDRGDQQADLTARISPELGQQLDAVRAAARATGDAEALHRCFAGGNDLVAQDQDFALLVHELESHEGGLIAIVPDGQARGLPLDDADDARGEAEAARLVPFLRATGPLLSQPPVFVRSLRLTRCLSDTRRGAREQQCDEQSFDTLHDVLLLRYRRGRDEAPAAFHSTLTAPGLPCPAGFAPVRSVAAARCRLHPVNAESVVEVDNAPENFSRAPCRRMAFWAWAC